MAGEPAGMAGAAVRVPAPQRTGAVTRGAWIWLAATVALTAGAGAAAIALAPPAGAAAPEGLAFLLFAGSSVHVASSGWFYTVPQVRRHMRRHRARYVFGPLALICGASAIAALLPRPVLYWLLLPYFGWQFFHYGKQNLGLAALAAAASRVRPLSGAERGSLTAGTAAGIAALLSRPALLQLPVRPPVPALFPLAVAGFAVAVAAGAGCLLARPAADRSAGFCVVYLTSLVFSLPVFCFRSPYAAVAGLTIAHGLQYLLLTGLVAAGGGGGTRRVVQLAALGNIALAGGAALSVASDQLAAGPVLRLLYGAFLGAVMAHFVIDAGLWRMRAEFPRSFLRSRLPYLLPAAAGGGEKYRLPIHRPAT